MLMGVSVFSWMFLLAEDDPSNPEAAVKAAGLQFNCVPVSVPAGLTAETASNVVESLNAMEKPSMVRCQFGLTVRCVQFASCSA